MTARDDGAARHVHDAALEDLRYELSHLLHALALAALAGDAAAIHELEQQILTRVCGPRPSLAED